MKKEPRIVFLKVFFALFAIGIVSKAFILQTFDNPKLDRLYKRQFHSKITALPERGYIFDRNGEGLAISLKVHSLFVRPETLRRDLPKKERTRLIANLSQILKLQQSALITKLDSAKGFVWIKRQLSQEEEQRLLERGLLDYGDGLALVQETKRFYPNRETASHILGAVNVDGQGLEGLELYYEKILNGESLRISSTKDAMGRRILQDDKGILAIRDGQSLILTIDKVTQYETEKNLKQAVLEQDARAGTAIVADVKTGEILAMANYPTFNPNEPHGATQEQRRNRAITDSFEPGSTFKPLIVGLALEKGKSPKTQIYCEKGSFVVGGRRISEAEAHEKYEWLSLGEILKFSSNVGSAKLAMNLGSQNISTLFEKLNLGKKTGIDLPGEVSGQASKDGLKSVVRLANVGFGHGLTVTPLQMLSYYLAIANKGVWVQPKIVKAVISEDPSSLEKGTLRWKIANTTREVITKNIFASKTTNQVSEMLEAVMVGKGTGTKAQLEEWPVAGKTGTAQKVDPQTKKYSKTKFVASFVGYAPAKNPSLVTFVLIDEPKRKYYAGETAAPAFREIMRSALLRAKVPAVVATNKIQNLANQAWIDSMKDDENSPQIDQSSNYALTEENELIRLMPDLRGNTIREAMQTLKQDNSSVEIIGSGILKNQHPEPKQVLKPATKIKLYFSEP